MFKVLVRYCMILYFMVIWPCKQGIIRYFATDPCRRSRLLHLHLLPCVCEDPTVWNPWHLTQLLSTPSPRLWKLRFCRCVSHVHIGFVSGRVRRSTPSWCRSTQEFAADLIGIASANSTLHLYFGLVLIQANVSYELPSRCQHVQPKHRGIGHGDAWRCMAWMTWVTQDLEKWTSLLEGCTLGSIIQIKPSGKRS